MSDAMQVHGVDDDNLDLDGDEAVDADLDVDLDGEDEDLGFDDAAEIGDDNLDEFGRIVTSWNIRADVKTI